MNNSRPRILRTPMWLMAFMVSLVGVGAGSSRAFAGLPLETETARPAPAGTLTLEMAVERQTSPEASELNIPFALEYSPTDRLEILVEPVAHSRLRAGDRAIAKGVGDLEVSAITLVRQEGRSTPAISLAGEVKFPTAKNTLIGSGKADVAGYFIASKRLGKLDAHFNLGYTLVGRPAGVDTKNSFSFATAVERKYARYALVGEVYGSTATIASGAEGASVAGESATAPEIGGAELVGTLGVRRSLGGRSFLSLGLSVDSNGAVIVHPGLSMGLR